MTKNTELVFSCACGCRPCKKCGLEGCDNSTDAEIMEYAEHLWQVRDPYLMVSLWKRLLGCSMNRNDKMKTVKKC